MLFKNKFIVSAIVIITILICGMGVMYFMKEKKPTDIIESKVKIKLTSSSNIVNFSHDSTEESFKAKISIADQSMNEINEQLNGFFGVTAPSKATKRLPNFKNTCSWWDLDDKNIESTYMRFVDEKKLFSRKSHEVWAFISKDHSRQNYLYISY